MNLFAFSRENKDDPWSFQMSFDQLAPFYRTMEFFTAGEKLQRCRIAFLDEVPSSRRILIAGEGHGRFLPECVKRFPGAEIVVVDISAKMLEIARSKSDNSSRISFQHADFLEWDTDEKPFDLIVTNFFLDCFDERQLPIAVAKLARYATNDADWLLADFQIAESRWAGLRSRVIVKMLYVFFGLICGLRANELIPPDSEISRAGFVQLQKKNYEWGLLRSEWWSRRK
jgi:ubiquinone/menaquinone biosynthesis C-methylase UbiE